MPKFCASHRVSGMAPRRRRPQARPVARWLTGLLRLLLLLLALAPAAQARAADSAVVLMYHRFGEDAYPTTSVTMAQFRAHIMELTGGDYHVMPLADILSALRNGQALPERAVAISVDDAYLSVYERAWPLLREHNLPFTLFVATETVDRRIRGYMRWDQIRELHRAGVTIASQGVTHPHMPDDGMTKNRWELESSAARIATETGVRPRLFAYPYGEASAEIARLVAEAGYGAAFGQHSGVIHAGSDPWFLPRFPVNVNFGDMERFRRVINAAALPVSDLVPRDPWLSAPGAANPPQFGFTLDGAVERAADLACYGSNMGRIAMLERLGPRVEVRFAKPFPPGRTRINCTVPTRDGRWRWFGMQYYVSPGAAGAAGQPAVQPAAVQPAVTPEAETQTDAGTDTQTDTGTDTQANTQTDTGTDTDANADTNANADTTQSAPAGSE